MPNPPEHTRFKPGQSGNPSGRPKNPLPELIRDKTKNGEEIIDAALRLLRKSKKESTVAWACEFLRDTGWHKPIQGIRTVDGEGNDVIPAIQFIPFGTGSNANPGNKGL